MELSTSSDPPLDRLPKEKTPGEKVLQQNSIMASKLLADFDISEAGKMVQKRRPAGFILDDELLLSDDEGESQPPAKKVAKEAESTETKTLTTNTTPEKQTEKQLNKIQKPNQQQQQNLGKRKKPQNRPVHTNRSAGDSATRDGGNDGFARKRGFMESDSGFNANPSSNFGEPFLNNERNFNTNDRSNFSSNDRFDEDGFSRRPNRSNSFGNEGFTSFGGNRSNSGGNGGRMFNNNNRF